jgi:hypothetical protein
MLSAAGLRLPYGFSSPAEDDTANMALESFLLHFRNLRAFLCPSLQKPRRDDVIASDFLGSPKAEDQANPKVLGRRKRKIDKLLAHISYSREGYVRRGAKSWPGPRMLGDVRAALRQFLDRLPPERRDWFIKDLQVQEAMSAPEGKASAETGCTSTVVTTDLVEFLGFGLVAGQDDQ